MLAASSAPKPQVRGASCTTITRPVFFTEARMVSIAEQAAVAAEAAGISVEVLDLRTLMPFDLDAILASVKKTGRVVIVHEAPRTCGFGAELAATIQEHAILHMEAPILRVTGFDTPFPYTLEHEYLPDAERILDAVERVVNF